MDNSTELHNHAEDAVVVVVWTIMLLYGLIANCLIQVGIYRNPTMRTSTSYWFIISLSLCDIFMILISLLHIIPATAFHDEFLIVKSLRNIWAIFFYDLFWYTGVLILGLMAVNRFVSIVYPTSYKQLFSPRRTAYVIGSLYSVGLAVSIPTLFPCCHTIYDHNWYVTTYDPVDSMYFIIDVLVNSFTVILMTFCYAVILAKVRKSRQAMTKYRLNAQKKAAAPVSSESPANNGATTSRSDGRSMSTRMKNTNYVPLGPPPTSALSSREMRLFLQFFLVSLVFLLTWSTWQWLPRLSASKWVYFTLTSFFFINNAVNPTVYLIFNSTLRREVRAVLKIGHASGTLSNSGSKEKNDIDNKKASAAGGSSSNLLKVSSGLPARSSSCNSQVGLLRKKDECPMSPSSLSASNVPSEGFKLISTKSFETSQDSSQGFRSPDALLGDCMHELMSPETIRDDATISSMRLSKEGSGISFTARSDHRDDSMVNLMSPMTPTPEFEEPLTPVIRVDSTAVIKEKYEPRMIIEYPNSNLSDDHQVIMKLISSDSELEPEDDLEDEEEELLPPAVIYNRHKLRKGVSEPSAGCNNTNAVAVCDGGPPLLRNRSMSDTEWAAAVAQTRLIPIFSKDDELFIYTSTV